MGSRGWHRLKIKFSFIQFFLFFFFFPRGRATADHQLVENKGIVAVILSNLHLS